MNLLVNTLKNAIDDLAKRKLTGDGSAARAPAYSVEHKVNAKGDLVIALIIPPSRPGEWSR